MRLKTTITATCLIFLLAACNKKDHTVSKTEMLTTGSWKLTGAESDDDGNGTYETNDYAIFPACFTDNFYVFKTGGQLVMDEGVSKCDQMDPQTETSSWSFVANETELVIDADNYEIKVLNNTTLKLKLDYGAGRSSQITFIKR